MTEFKGIQILLLTILLSAACHLSFGQTAISDSFYSELPLGQIKPKGWLLNQLQIMRSGSSGHLDEIHDKLKNDNGWLGGKGDGWEETPYWLDGAVPLAFQLDDKVLKDKVLKYINWTLENQRPSGYFGAITPYERDKNTKVDVGHCSTGDDWWPKMVMLKVMQQYYEATGDKRVVPFMIKYFQYQMNTLKVCPIGKWSEWSLSRGADNVMMVQWLYSITKKKWLLDLAALIDSQSFAWSDWLGNRDWVMNAAAQQNGTEWMKRHGVNVAMALKAPAINFERTHDRRYLTSLKTGWNDLMNLHGLPMGIFSADEDLHGNDPTQGVELCAIVECMYSLEKIIAISGDTQYMDALERMTFNALPTQTTDDYMGKQYFQIANQVEVSRGVFDFSLPFDRRMNNVFGLRSGYTCCTTNMHQGWTKYVSHLWYATPKGVAALVYGPNELKTKINNQEVSIREVTNYPFDDQINFEIQLKKDMSFPISLRIPIWCNEATITLNGMQLQSSVGGKVVVIERVWHDGDKLVLKMPMHITTSNWGRNSRAIERGPLVYALKLDEQWKKGNETSEGEYFSIHTAQDWNYGIVEEVVKNAGANVDVKTALFVDNFVWNKQNAPIELQLKARKIPSWKNVDGVAHQPVTARDGIYKGEVGNIESIKLIPYGCTKVRVVAFPVVGD